MKRYPGNVPSNVSKDAKYSVVAVAGGWQIRLIYRLSSSERALVTTSSHPELVEMVNAAKLEGTEGAGGAFYINEYRHVIVPTAEGCLYAGKYAPLLCFKFEGQEISPEAPSAMQPGQDWLGPRVGTAYVLAADGTDVKYRVETRPNVVMERRLSAEIGNAAAARAARQFSRHKPGGGRVYVNEARECFGPTRRDEPITHTYLGRIQAEAWFAEPKV
jgi:hypothetical protein